MIADLDACCALAGSYLCGHCPCDTCEDCGQCSGGGACACECMRAERAAVLRDAAEAVDNTEFPDEYVDLFDNGARWASRLLRRLAGEAAAGAHQAEQAQPELTDAERHFLTFAMDLAFDEMVSNDGFTDEDHAALKKFRALATPPAVPAAPEETQ